MRRVVCLIGMTCLALAACGDDDGGGGTSTREQEYVDAAMESFDEEDLPFEEDEAECFAARFVDVVGVEAFEAADIEPEDFGDEDFDPAEAGLELDEAQGRGIGDALQQCGVSMADLFISGVEEDGGEVSDDLRACLEENIDEERFAEVFGQAFVDPAVFDDEPPEEFMSLFFELAAACPEIAEL
jgi:hypothetical protein